MKTASKLALFFVALLLIPVVAFGKTCYSISAHRISAIDTGTGSIVTIDVEASGSNYPENPEDILIDMSWGDGVDDPIFPRPVTGIPGMTITDDTFSGAGEITHSYTGYESYTFKLGMYHRESGDAIVEVETIIKPDKFYTETGDLLLDAKLCLAEDSKSSRGVKVGKRRRMPVLMWLAYWAQFK